MPNRSARVLMVAVSALTAIFATLIQTSANADVSQKLSPLNYNHPGLEVDLGVGLWAYPLPMDFDNDGDMDLVVSCPDKPSNGTYFFENPTQNPGIKMPVFKPAVRIGKGHHYMLLSELDGEPVVLRPTQIYRRDPKTRQFDFNQSSQFEGVMNHPNVSSSGRTRANMWRMVDYDGDGDHDVVIGLGDWSDLGWDHAYDSAGNWRNGPLHGYLYLITNDGSDASPNYSKTPVRIQADGADLDVYGWPCHNWVDFDGDGDLDILSGNFLDRFTYFQNTGSRTEPIYAAGQLLNDVEGEPLTMHVQMITPTAIDWDGDGDHDLIVGDEDGRVALVENTGELREGTPVFKSPVYFRQQADTLKFGALATPYAFDWDGDGDEDIVCGNTSGNIALFENLSEEFSGATDGSLPRWAAPVLLNERDEDGNSHPFRIMAGPSGSIQGPCEAKWGYTTLSVADWDGDGDGDIVYNSILAKVGLLINDKGTLTRQSFDTGLIESPPAWYPNVPPTASTLTQWRTTPVVIDFDGDQSLDLVMLDQEGYLTLRRSCGSAERIFVDENGAPIRLNAGTAGRSGRVKISVADWDGDERLDVLVNSENVTWYRNVADHEGKIVLKRVGNLSTRNVAGHTASPAVCDFNGDGVPDMMVGSENGRIYYIAHDDCVQFDEASKTAKLNVDSSPAAEKVPPPPAKNPRIMASTSTTRGQVAVWVESVANADDPDSLGYSYHDGVQWSGVDMIALDGRFTVNGLSMSITSPDETIVVTCRLTQADGSKRSATRVSYDRGRTFRTPVTDEIK